MAARQRRFFRASVGRCALPLAFRCAIVRAESPPWALWEKSLCVGRESEFAVCPDLPECDVCEPEDCKFSHWVEWSEGNCDGLCERRRGFKKNNACGAPCEGVTADSKAESGCYDCLNANVTLSNGSSTAKDDSDRCKWSEWKDWSQCDAECGGGSHTRTRSVEVTHCSSCDEPLAQKDLCEARSKKEVEPCNMQPCGGECKWKEWSAWSICSATCDGGLHKRRREILGTGRAKITKAECIHPPVGLVEELRPCNTDVACPASNPDCEFSDWEEWTGCSCSCDGVSHRTRVISKGGRGTGAACAGETQEIRPCNPVIGGDRPLGCSPVDPVDCKLSDWEQWSTCSAPCGGGQKSRGRSLDTPAQAGGRPCEGPLAETLGCNSEPCKIDCKWTEWSSWSACEKCGGERKRFRHISQMPRHGGVPCESGASEEQDRCPRICHARAFCAWGDWEDFRDCSATCGSSGHRERGRNLKVVEVAPGDFVQDFDAGLKDQVEQLRAHTSNREARRMRELATAFCLGLMCLFVVSGASRALWRRGTQA